MSGTKITEFTGGCYCGALRYKAVGNPLFKVLCHCDKCQIFSGGMAALLIGMPKSDFVYTSGQPTILQNRYNEEGSHREFCSQCGTHILAATVANPEMVSIKVGTMDNSDIYGMPNMALQLADKKSFHIVPDGVYEYQEWPWS